MRRIVIAALLATSVACVGDFEQQEERGLPTAPALDKGTWRLGHAELANDCGSEGILFPLGPSAVTIERRAGEVTLRSVGREPRTYQVDGNRWVRERNETLGDCDGSLVETFIVHGHNSSQLSATYEANLELSASCELPSVHSCSVRYSVWGGRR